MDWDIEFQQRLLIAGVMLWGTVTKLFLMGYQIDRANKEERLTLKVLLWENSQKWKIMGSSWLIIGLAFIAPHQGFVQLQEFVFHGVPLGHLGTAAIGFLGDDLFVSLDSIRKWVGGKFNRDNGKE